MGKGKNSGLNHYWGKGYAPLTNSGGMMVLRTTNGTRVVCPPGWPLLRGSCPR